MVDEAGMLDQEATRALLDPTTATTDVAMIGDRAQLSAVGRGGVLDMAVVGHLLRHPDEVHRFGDDTEYAELSKLMRNRDRLDEVFDRLVDRGNVRIHHSADEARESLAEAVRSDIAAGRSIAVTATNDQAAALNADIQAQRIAAGHLKTDDHSTTGRDGLDIFAGDTVMTRSNNRPGLRQPRKLPRNPSPLRRWTGFWPAKTNATTTSLPPTCGTIHLGLCRH